MKKIEFSVTNKSKDNREKQPLKEFFVEENIKSKANNEYPVISSTKDDVFLQSEYFNNQVASSNNIGYKVLKRDRIVLSPQNAWMGNINLNYKYDIGIVSPSYKIFRIENANTNFFKYLIKTPKFIDRIDKFSEQGASVVRKNLNLEELLDSKVYLPTIQEQEKIGGFLSSFDNLIQKQQEKIGFLKELKKGYLQQMFPAKGANLPQIRFEGFADAWEQRELSELATFSKGSGYSKGDLVDNGSPIILYGRLYTKYETSISDVDTFVVQKSGSVISAGGEVIVPASGETAEDIAIASVVEKPGIILGGDLNVIHPKEMIESTFLALSITNGFPHIDMAKRAQGKSVVHLHNTDLKKVILSFPKKEEQIKISQYFMKLDSLITLHQLKLEKLQEMKKGYMQRLF
jgi:type I restriction enzyme S subunit